MTNYMQMLTGTEHKINLMHHLQTHVPTLTFTLATTCLDIYGVYKPMQPITYSIYKPLHMQIVAGAIAGKIREARKVVITAVGIDAVANMVLAVGNARIYLEENDIDIKVEPSFERQTKNGQELTVMRFDLIAEAI